LARQERLMDLPKGSSVYTMALSPDGERLATGSKSGEIHVFSGMTDGRPALCNILGHSAPIVSLCWHDRSILFFADPSGRVLSSQAPHTTAAIFAEPNGTPICGLLRAGEGLAGVAVKGGFVLWENLGDSRAKRLDGPPPPEPYSWVKTVFHEDSRSVFCPTRSGGLTRLEMDRHEVITMPAHEEAFYALHELDGQLLTIGARDGRARLWNLASFGFDREMPAPSGIVALGLTGNAEAPLVVVAIDGSAYACRIDNGGIQPVGSAKRGDYRCCVGISARSQRQLREARRQARVRETAAAAKERLQTGNLSSCEAYAAELISLGRKDLGLVIQAEMAARQGDVCRELTCRKVLCEFLPDTIEALPSLWRHVHLLARLFLYDNAAALCRRIATIAPESRGRAAMVRLAHLEDLVSSGHGLARLAECNDADALIKAWQLTDCFPPLRLLLKEFEELDCYGLRIASHALVRACQEPPIGGTESTAMARLEELPLVSGWKDEGPSHFVVFSCTSDEHLGLEFAMRFREEEGQTVVRPMLMFNTNPQASRDRSGHERTVVHRRLQAILREGRGEHWIARTAEAAEQALAHLVSAGLAEQRRNQG
ncbi:MAG: hypothetical protein KJ052_15580, partial [Candidatus Hydrogenedentes bacterium]|nr:hypothetical protein [Candidatus Hydrogenedentota bacterium]